jgi:hypothetical protein
MSMLIYLRKFCIRASNNCMSVIIESLFQTIGRGSQRTFCISIIRPIYTWTQVLKNEARLKETRTRHVQLSMRPFSESRIIEICGSIWVRLTATWQTYILVQYIRDHCYETKTHKTISDDTADSKLFSTRFKNVTWLTIWSNLLVAVSDGWLVITACVQGHDLYPLIFKIIAELHGHCPFDERWESKAGSCNKRSQLFYHLNFFHSRKRWCNWLCEWLWMFVRIEDLINCT